MSVRFQIAVLVFMMVQAVVFGVGTIIVLATPLTRLHQLRGLGDAKVLKSLGRSPKGRHYRG
jgi:hypothetical protein